MDSGSTVYPRPARRGKTTGIGIVIVVLGCLSLGYILAVYAGIGAAESRGVEVERYGIRLTGLTITISVIGTLKSVGLIASGAAMVRRSARTLTLFGTTFVISLIHSATKIVQYIELGRPSTSAGTEEAWVAGFWLGISCSNAVSIFCYVAVIRYLRNPLTRREFGLEPDLLDGVFE